MMKKCNKNYDLTAFCKNELPNELKDEISSHLNVCPSCSSEYSFVKEIFSLLNEDIQITPTPNFVNKTIESLPKRKKILGIDYFIPNYRTGLKYALTQTVEFVYALSKIVWNNPVLNQTKPIALSAAVHVFLFVFITAFSINYIMDNKANDNMRVVIKWKQRPGNMYKFEEIKLSEKKINVPMDDEEENMLRSGIGRPGKDGFAPRSNARLESSYRMKKKGNKIMLNKQAKSKNALDKDQKIGATIKRPKEYDTTLMFYIASWREKEKKLRSKEIAQAIKQGLDWLMSIQKEDGHWDPKEFDGMSEYSLAITSISTLNFIIEYEKDTNNSKIYQNVIDKSINYIIRNQELNTGLIGDRTGNYMYNHIISLLTLIEYYSTFHDKEILTNISLGLKYMVKTQSEKGGWGYFANAIAPDTSINGWASVCLRYADAIGFSAVDESIQRLDALFESMKSENGTIGYNKKGDYPNGFFALTSIGLFSKYMLNMKMDAENYKLMKEKILMGMPNEKTPKYDNDFYYWMFASMAFNQAKVHDKTGWNYWSKNVYKKVLSLQDKDKRYQGSWKPIDKWSKHGGRIYATSMNILTLQTQYHIPILENLLKSK